MSEAKLFYLGPEQTFSEQAGRSSALQARLVPAENFIAISQQVCRSDQHYGLMPLENSTTCNVHESIDLIIEHKLRICEEIFLPVNFNLVATKELRLGAVEEIFAHPMAAKQCRQFLAASSAVVTAAASNVAAWQLAEKAGDTAAAIVPAHFRAKSSHPIQTGIADSKNNYTRFVVVNRTDNFYMQNESKVTLLLKLKHQAGSLAALLNKLAAASLNLTKIESRAIAGTEWEYLFWVDLETSGMSAAEVTALLDQCVTAVTVIGRY